MILELCVINAKSQSLMIAAKTVSPLANVLRSLARPLRHASRAPSRAGKFVTNVFLKLPKAINVSKWARTRVAAREVALKARNVFRSLLKESNAIAARRKQRLRRRNAIKDILREGVPGVARRANNVMRQADRAICVRKLVVRRRVLISMDARAVMRAAGNAFLPAGRLEAEATVPEDMEEGLIRIPGEFA